MNGVNYHVDKSKSEKFEAKCAVQDGTCSWKIMASLRKKTGLWEIKKYKGPHTCVAGIVLTVSEQYFYYAMLHYLMYSIYRCFTISSQDGFSSVS